MMRTILLACAALAVATGANAATVFNFGTIADTASLTTGDLGATATYTIGGLSVFAAAFGPNNVNGTPDHLYGKNLGGDENGLGMTNDPSGDHEIYYQKGFVQLSFSNNVNLNAIFASFNSTTGGEKWEIFGGNSAGVLNSNVINAGGTTEGTNVQLTGGYKYYDIVSIVAAGGASGGNVLVKSVTLSGAVPEPATWGLMLVGFGGLGAALRRRRALAALA
jgi:hypothetical protein